MTKIKIMSVRDEDIPYIEEWATKNKVEVELNKAFLTEENVDSVQGFDGLSLSQQHPLSEEVFAKLQQFGIKQIAQRSAGFDTYDLNLASKYNIIVSNVPSYSPSSIAEFAVTQAINIVRNQNDIQCKLRAHDFRWEPSILSRSISELTVAVIGTGRIGSITAKIFAKGYNSRVVAYDPFPSEHVAQYVDYKNTLEDALKEADIVTVHIPETKYNHHLFDASHFAQFKRGAVFVNAARGSIVDTKALLSAIDEGHIKGAALDTYEHERGLFPGDYRQKAYNDELLDELIAREDILLTPHIAFYTDAAVKNLIVDALDATMDVLNTGTTRLRVN
ncbi:D-lactate dehydrogenase [Staphylococcus sp. NRL 16/872]|uniref:D-lactate dehydrogenase n=1 Tax=Staphylococcus sp. NRL 16/872 TaxID=2930131 RepID=UPI001FB27FFD|nr:MULTISPECIES: D-lactate dehydrogenase [unclassified Staphylococcus]MCJ1655526.1 D-lactate dehydrogenase [Staphylococcus sp. NRL 21/187]MCJ1661359.1 D-lactate dehydrogenase [Staphylococcus sp. NRL 18/288]WEN69735.1 D-lactate dehydrogenase [Staphylococcus sp. NRL 16/872]